LIIVVLHLAAAETVNADYLLTTDIDFISYSKRFTHNVKVVNPCDFLEELKYETES
jgi:predicted nucleic acid-binding protein